MRDTYWSIACRKSFTVTSAQLAAAETVVLALNYDDGFIAYLNGTEVARSGVGSPGDDTPFDAPAADHEAGTEEEFTIPKGHLAAGQNLLAVEVHNTALSSSDLSFIPRLLLRRTIAETEAPAVPVFINEVLARTNGERWIELLNGGGSDLSLAGYHVSDDAARLWKFTFPAGAAVPRGGFLVLTEAESGLGLGAPELTLFLSAPDPSRVIDAHLFENAGHPERFSTSDIRFPDGSSNWAFARAPTRGTRNELQVEADLVLNEIMYHPFESRNAAGEPVESRPGEYDQARLREVASGAVRGFVTSTKSQATAPSQKLTAKTTKIRSFPRTLFSRNGTASSFPKR